jgi:hypothetical protein
MYCIHNMLCQKVYGHIMVFGLNLMGFYQEIVPTFIPYMGVYYTRCCTYSTLYYSTPGAILGVFGLPWTILGYLGLFWAHQHCPST